MLELFWVPVRAKGASEVEAFLGKIKEEFDAVSLRYGPSTG